MAETLRSLEIPILGVMEAPATAEGGDLLWLGSDFSFIHTTFVSHLCFVWPQLRRCNSALQASCTNRHCATTVRFPFLAATFVWSLYRDLGLRKMKDSGQNIMPNIIIHNIPEVIPITASALPTSVTRM